MVVMQFTSGYNIKMMKKQKSHWGYRLIDKK